MLKLYVIDNGWMGAEMVLAYNQLEAELHFKEFTKDWYFGGFGGFENWVKNRITEYSLTSPGYLLSTQGDC